MRQGEHNRLALKPIEREQDVVLHGSERAERWVSGVGNRAGDAGDQLVLQGVEEGQSVLQVLSWPVLGHPSYGGSAHASRSGAGMVCRTAIQ